MATAIRCLAATYYGGFHIRPHRHHWGQLIYAGTGMMRVKAGGTLWIVPPARAVWVPAESEHEIHGLGDFAMRTAAVIPPPAGAASNSRYLAAIEAYRGLRSEARLVDGAWPGPIASPLASRLSQRSFCASVPNRAIGSATSELLTVAITATTELAWASASIASA